MGEPMTYCKQLLASFNIGNCLLAGTLNFPDIKFGTGHHGSFPLFWYDNWLSCSTVVPGSIILREKRIFSYHLSCARLTFENSTGIRLVADLLLCDWSGPRESGPLCQGNLNPSWFYQYPYHQGGNMSVYYCTYCSALGRKGRLSKCCRQFPHTVPVATTVSLQLAKMYALWRAIHYQEKANI